MSDKDKYNIPRRDIKERIGKILPDDVVREFYGVYQYIQGGKIRDLDPLANAEQYDAIINQPDVLSNVCYVLAEWFHDWYEHKYMEWFTSPEYLSDIHAWTLRAHICWKEEG